MSIIRDRSFSDGDKKDLRNYMKESYMKEREEREDESQGGEEQYKFYKENHYKTVPAFQLNKFQNEYNLSFNQEMSKIIAAALQRHEEYLDHQGKNIPPPLFALLSRLEDLQKPKFYKDYTKGRSYEE